MPHLGVVKEWLHIYDLGRICMSRVCCPSLRDRVCAVRVSAWVGTGLTR